MANTSVALERLPSFLVPFFSLSYPTETPANPDSFQDSDYYRGGRLDVCLIITIIAVMAILRDVVRLCFAEPFARWKLRRDIRKARANRTPLSGHSPRIAPPELGEKTPLLRTNLTKKEERILNHNVLRFAEQSWALVYYSIQFCFGMYVHYRLPTTMSDMSEVWNNADIPIAGTVKFYYLTQTAFYTHQILILNAEAPRKDHWQMMLHHIISVALMAVSYSYHWIRIGCLIMVMMDWCDIWLCAGKMLKYLNFYSVVCDATFVFFMLSWFVTRHVLFIRVIISAFEDSKQVLPLSWSPLRFADGVLSACVSMLIALQILQIVWFVTICRVAYRVVMGEGAEDTRSDDEGEEEEKKER